MNTTLIFCALNTDCSENSPLHIRKTRSHRNKTLNVEQLLHHVDKKKNTKIYSRNQIMFLQSMNYRFLYGCSFNNLVALCADVLETPVSCISHLRNFLGEVSSLA
jgi:hypothetical protein